MATFSGNPAAGPLDGTEIIPITQGGVDKRTTPNEIGGLYQLVAIVTEGGTSTMVPATHAGLRRYLRCANDVTFDAAEGYAIGQVYNIRATAALTLIGTGVTLNTPAGGTLDLDVDMSVTVVMIAADEGDVVGQTVPV